MNSLTGKLIDSFAATQTKLPEYYGSYEYQFSKNTSKRKYFKGAFLAQKYKAIAEIVEQVKATVYVQPHCIHVTYTNGNFTVQRDILTDTFLLPLIQPNY